MPVASNVRSQKISLHYDSNSEVSPVWNGQKQDLEYVNVLMSFYKWPQIALVYGNVQQLLRKAIHYCKIMRGKIKDNMISGPAPSWGSVWTDGCKTLQIRDLWYTKDWAL